MAIKPEQIRTGLQSSDNNKLIISGAIDGANGIGQGMLAHADSQLDYALHTNNGSTGIKFSLKDATIHGAATSISGQNTQIEAGSIGSADIADGAITSDKILDATIVQGDLNIASQAWSFASATSFSVPTPTADGHAATKKYVDDSSQGLDFKDSVLVATTTYLDGSYATNVITGTNQEVLVIDGVTVGLGDRILVKNGLSIDAGVNTDLTANGIYVVTTLGVAGTEEWVLTRADDFNQDSEVTSGAYVLVTDGTANELTAYVLQSDSGDNPTLDTSDLNFVAFSGSATSVAGGNGIAVSGTTVSVDLAQDQNSADASGLAFDGNSKLKLDLESNTFEISATNKLSQKLGGQDATNTNASLQLTTAGTAGLALKVADTSIKVGTNGVQAAVLGKALDDQSAIASVSGTTAASTGIELDKIPAAGCDVLVYLNGVLMLVGDGTTTGAEVFFMPPLSSDVNDVRDFDDLAVGDKLWFNPAVTKFSFDKDIDVVKIVFMTTA